jgi:hypothetical protein
MAEEDRRIIVELSEDTTKAFITFAALPDAGGKAHPLWLTKMLKEREIVKGVDEKALNELCDTLNKTGVFKGRLLVAKAENPVNGQNAIVTILVRNGHVVRPGTILAERVPCKDGKNGFSLSGKIIQAARGSDKPLPVGEYAVSAVKDTKLISAVYGIARIADGKVHVKTPYDVSPDNMNVFLDITPRDFAGQVINIDDITKTLRVLGLKGAILEDEISRALLMGGGKKGVLVMKAIPPETGEKGRIEFLGPSGSIVLPGERVGRVLESGKGKDGTDVYGKTIKATTGQLVRKLELDKNLHLDQKKGMVASLVYGRLVYDNEKASVESAIVVSSDEFEARMVIASEGISGLQLEPEVIFKHIIARGILNGVDEDTITRAIRGAKKSRAVLKDVLIAKGTPVIHETGRKVKFNFLLDGQNPQNLEAPEEAVRRDFIFKGRPVAEVTPHREPRDGVTVFGKKIYAEHVQGTQIEAGAHVIESEDGKTFTAEVHGFSDYKGGVISVIPLFNISEDEMTVEMTLYPANAKKRALTAEVINRLLSFEKIVVGVDLKAVEDTVKKLNETGAPVTAVVAKGREPVGGKDGWLEHHVNFTKKVGEEREDGSIDYRERSFIPTVKEGTKVLTRHPPTKGKNGSTVYGKESPANQGIDLQFNAGEGVRVVDDYHYYASKSGAAVLTSRDIRILELFIVPGDVTLETGNIRFDGTVRIEGSVKSSFKVEATGSVEVLGSVDDAIVEAKGNIHIHGGIFHRGYGKIKAGGTVEVAFATNAVIEAIESIEIINDAVNCSLKTEGRINIIKGKGRAVGGRLVAGRNININELGSEGAVTTIAELAPPERIEKKLASIALELDEIEVRLEEITRKLYYLLQGGFENLPKERKIQVLYLKKEKEHLAEKKSELFSARDVVTAEKSRFENGEIRIYGTMWPGALVRIKGTSFTPNKSLHYSGFRYVAGLDNLERIQIR